MTIGAPTTPCIRIPIGDRYPAISTG